MIFSSNCTKNKQKKNYKQKTPGNSVCRPARNKEEKHWKKNTITRRMFSFENTKKNTTTSPSKPTRLVGKNGCNPRCLRLRGSTAEQQKATNRSSRFWWSQNDLYKNPNPNLGRVGTAIFGWIMFFLRDLLRSHAFSIYHGYNVFQETFFVLVYHSYWCLLIGWLVSTDWLFSRCVWITTLDPWC